MLGSRCSKPFSGGPPLAVSLCVSPGVGVILGESGASSRVPLSPRGQRLMHSDGMSLHLALQAVHLLLQLLETAVEVLEGLLAHGRWGP